LLFLLGLFYFSSLVLSVKGASLSILRQKVPQKTIRKRMGLAHTYACATVGCILQEPVGELFFPDITKPTLLLMFADFQSSLPCSFVASFVPAASCCGCAMNSIVGKSSKVPTFLFFPFVGAKIGFFSETFYPPLKKC